MDRIVPGDLHHFLLMRYPHPTLTVDVLEILGTGIKLAAILPTLEPLRIQARLRWDPCSRPVLWMPLPRPWLENGCGNTSAGGNHLALAEDPKTTRATTYLGAKDTNAGSGSHHTNAPSCGPVDSLPAAALFSVRVGENVSDQSHTPSMARNGYRI